MHIVKALKGTHRIIVWKVMTSSIKFFSKVYELLLYYDYKFKMNEEHKLRLNCLP